MVCLGIPAVAVGGPKPLQQVCGVVVSAGCPRSNEKSVLMLLVQPGVTVDVDAASPEQAEALAPRAASLIFSNACVTGKLVGKLNEKELARLQLGSGDIVGSGVASPDWSPGAVHNPCETQFSMPTVLGQAPRPSYTADAMTQKIQGRALVQVIVGTDGRVEQARLLKTLDAKYGLDEEALKCARRWTFKPATNDGVPVRMAIVIEMTFTLK
jgi:TonB family protein